MVTMYMSWRPLQRRELGGKTEPEEPTRIQPCTLHPLSPGGHMYTRGHERYPCFTEEGPRVTVAKGLAQSQAASKHWTKQ